MSFVDISKVLKAKPETNQLKSVARGHKRYAYM